MLLYRLTRRVDRSKVLAYPAIFIVTRMAMLVIRAVLSRATSLREGLFSELLMKFVLHDADPDKLPRAFWFSSVRCFYSTL